MKTDRTTTDLEKRLMEAWLKMPEEGLVLVELIVDKMISGELSDNQLIALTTEARKQAHESGEGFLECFSDLFQVFLMNGGPDHG